MAHQGPPDVRFTRQDVEATVKMQVLVDGVSSWIPIEANAAVIVWLNAWLGPHWIVMPAANGIEITRSGCTTFRGHLREFRDSRTALEHGVKVKFMQGDDVMALHALADGLEEMLQDAGSAAGPWDLQRQVQEYFRQVLRQ